MEIYKYVNGTKTTLQNVVATDSSYHYEEIMGDNNVVLYFSLPFFFEFPVGCHINFDNVEYTLLELGSFNKINERNYEYTLTFESPQKRLSCYKLRNKVDGRLSFTLTAQPFEFIELIVWNMNQRDGGGWSIGECVTSAEKVQSFNHNSLLDALNTVAQLFETEWEIVNKTINLRKVEYNKEERTVNRLSYGRGNGFISGVSRQNSGEKAVDVLWVEGGDRNIDQSTYTYTKVIEGQTQTLHANKLRLPKNKTYYYKPSSDSTKKGTAYDMRTIRIIFGNNTDKINAYIADCMQVITDEDGFGVKRAVFINNGYEDSLELSDIYPSLKLNVATATLIDKDKRFWNIKARDVSGVTRVNYNDYIIAGETMTIIFNTGMLTGKEFDISKYDYSKNEFEIVPAAIDGITMPDLAIDDQDSEGKHGTGYIPRAKETSAGEVTYEGDEFAVFHVALPSEYISKAENDLLIDACEYLYKHGEVEVEFNGTLDAIWAKNKWATLSNYLILGGYINFFDNAFCQDGKMLRILSVKQYLNNPHAPEITLSNSTVAQGITSEIKKIATNEQYYDYKIAQERAAMNRRSFKDSEETQKALQSWAEYYNNILETYGDDLTEEMKEQLRNEYSKWDKAISPITIQTMQMLVGDKNLQYEFGAVYQWGDDDAVVSFNRQSWSPYWNSEGALVCPANFANGDEVYMRHSYYANTGNDTQQSDGTIKNIPDADYPYWEIIKRTFVPANPDSPYYLYLKCPRTALSAENRGKVKVQAQFELVEIKTGTMLPYNTDEMFWFLVGIVNAEVSGARSYANMFGSVEISGSQIKLSQIVSNNNTTMIDVINNTVTGNINMLDGQVTYDLVLGTDKYKNFGGMTSDEVLDGDTSRGRLTNGKVRMWIGSGAQIKVKNNKKYLYGGQFVVYNDGQFWSKYGIYSTNAWKSGKISIDRYLYVHDYLEVDWAAYFHSSVSIDGVLTAKDDTYCGTNKYDKHIFKGNIYQDRYQNQLYSGGNSKDIVLRGIVPTMIWYGYYYYKNNNNHGLTALFTASSVGDYGFNGNIISSTRYSRGMVRIQLNSQLNGKYMIKVIAKCNANNDSNAYACVSELIQIGRTPYWMVQTADDSSQNDADFWIEIWQLNDY